METLQKIQSLPASKDGIQLFVDTTIDRIIAGDLDPLQLAPSLKAMEEIVKGIRENKDVKNVMMGMIEEMGEKKVQYGNATISIVETGRLDYSGDPVWDGIKKEEERCATIRKQREEILKTVTSEFPDPVNEGVLLKPPVKNYSQIIKVTLK